MRFIFIFNLIFIASSLMAQDEAVSVNDLNDIESDIQMEESSQKDSSDQDQSDSPSIQQEDDTTLEVIEAMEQNQAEEAANAEELPTEEFSQSDQEANSTSTKTSSQTSSLPLNDNPPSEPSMALPTQAEIEQVPSDDSQSTEGVNDIDRPADQSIPMQTQDMFTEPEMVPVPSPSETTPAFRTMDQDINPLVEKIDEPNLFAGAPPIPGTMRIMASGEAPEEYRVRMGDTLFDICDQLLDEPGYWPKLWAINPFIRNPHFIYPGMVLRFYPGDQSTPPFLRVVTEDELVPVDTAGINQDELIVEDMSRLLTKSELPDQTSIIGADEIQAFPELDEAFVTSGSVFKPSELQVILPVFMFEDEVDEVGTIVGGTAGSFLMDRGQDIIVQQETDLAVGTLYTVVRLSRKVYHPNDGGFLAYRYEFIGQIKVLKSLEDDIYAAEVIFNRLGLQPGDLVIPYRSVKRTVPLTVSGKAGQNNVVIGFDQPESEIGGRGSFVVFESKEQSLKVGDAIHIFQNVKKAATEMMSQRLPDFRKRVATAHIVESSEIAAVGYVVEDRFEVRIGDDTGS